MQNKCKHQKFPKTLLKCSRLIHVCSCSLNKSFEDLQCLLTEKRIKKNLEITKSITLKNYNFEYTPTESTAGGTIYSKSPILYPKA